MKLAVKQDDAGIFKGAYAVYYAMPLSGGFNVIQIVDYPPAKDYFPSTAPPTTDIEGVRGRSQRIIFIAEKPLIKKVLSEDSSDTIRFIGIDAGLPGYVGQPLLHFRRTVEGTKQETGVTPSELDKEFTENMWFAKGKGLVRLEQQIEGESSMLWILSRYSEP